MRRFFVILFILFIFTSCTTKKQPDGASAESAAPTLGIPLPTPEILAVLGPENDIPIQRLLPNTIFVVVGKPKQFLASPVCVGGELYIQDLIRQTLQPFFDPNKIVRFVRSNGSNPLFIQVGVRNPQDPNAPPQQGNIIRIDRWATIVTFEKPFDKTELLTTALGGNPDPTFHELFKRTEGKNEYYDLTRQDIDVPFRVVLGIIDETNVVIAQGIKDDIKAIFSDTITRNPSLERLKRTPVDANDITIITSLEGVNVSPQMFEAALAGIGLPVGISSGLETILNNLRAVSLSVNASAATGQPVVTIRAEGKDEKGAEIISDNIGGLILMGQMSMDTMGEEIKHLLPIAPDFVAGLLKAVSVEHKGTLVNAVLNNFEALIPTIAEGIKANQNALLRDARFQNMNMLAGLCTMFSNENEKKYPADILGADGKPLLSWRVALLPILGMEDLYKKFKLDEPWNSETNKELLKEMPGIFHHLTPDADPTKTAIRFFDSAGTPFSNRELTSQSMKSPQTTLMFVYVTPQYAVEWTKPEPLEFNADKIADILGDMLLGVTFWGHRIESAVPPITHPNYEKWKKEIEALIHGTLSQPEVQPGQSIPY
jgi:hypothetical protein